MSTTIAAGRPLLRSISSAMLVNVAGLALAFAAQVALARLMSTEAFGIYAYVTVWINLLALVAKLGYDVATLRFVPQYRSHQDWSLLRGFTAFSRRHTLISSCIVAGVTLIAVLASSAVAPTALVASFLCAIPLIPLHALTITYSAYLQAVGRVVWSQGGQMVLRPLLLIAAIALVSGAGQAVDSRLALLIYLIVSALVLVLVIWLARSEEATQERAASAAQDTTSWKQASYALLLVTLFNMVLNSADVLLLGMLADTTQAGIYSAATRVALLIQFAITAANIVMAPMMSRLYAQHQREELQRAVHFTAAGTLLMSIPVCGLLLIGPQFVLGIYGPQFASASTALQILSVARLCNALFGLSGYLMSMTGHHRQAAQILGGVALLAVLLNLVLIPAYGMNGAAASTAIASATWGILMTLQVRSRIKIDATIFTMRRLWR